MLNKIAFWYATFCEKSYSTNFVASDSCTSIMTVSFMNYVGCHFYYSSKRKKLYWLMSVWGLNDFYTTISIRMIVRNHSGTEVFVLEFRTRYFIVAWLSILHDMAVQEHWVVPWCCTTWPGTISSSLYHIPCLDVATHTICSMELVQVFVGQNQTFCFTLPFGWKWALFGNCVLYITLCCHKIMCCLLLSPGSFYNI